MKRSFKKYHYINNVVDGERIEYYQVPFSLGQGDGTCLEDDEGYLLCQNEFHVYDYITNDDIEKALGVDLAAIEIYETYPRKLAALGALAA